MTTRLHPVLLILAALPACRCEEPAPVRPVDTAPGHVSVVDAVRPAGGALPTAEASDLSRPPREGDVGWWVDLALGPQGEAHLAYTDAFDGALRHAEQTADGWKVVEVDRYGAVGKYPAIAVDADGRPHVIYYNQDKRRLYYAARVGEDRVDPDDRRRPWKADPAWLFEVVDDGREVGMAAELMVGRDGTLHGVYYTGDERLIHAWRPPTKPGEHAGWERRVIDQPAGGSHSIVLGLAEAEDGTLHVSYAHWSVFDSELRYARLPKGAAKWETESLTKEANAGWKSGLVLDDDDEPVIVFLALMERELRAARKNAQGEWTYEKIVGEANTMDVGRGPDGRLVLAYEHLPGSGFAGARVRYLVREDASGDLSQGWKEYALGPGGELSSYLALGVRAGGRPVIAFYDGNIRGVRVYLPDEAEAEAAPAAKAAPEAPAAQPATKKAPEAPAAQPATKKAAARKTAAEPSSAAPASP